MSNSVSAARAIPLHPHGRAVRPGAPSSQRDRADFIFRAGSAGRSLFNFWQEAWKSARELWYDLIHYVMPVLTETLLLIVSTD